MWPLWDCIHMPRLAIRVATSDLPLPDTFARMAASATEMQEAPETGHEPALFDPLRIGAIRSFLIG